MYDDLKITDTQNMGLFETKHRPVTQRYASIFRAYKQPTYLYDTEQLKQNLQAYQACLGPHARVFYSVKANPCHELMHILHQGGAGMEVSSDYELQLALRAGASPHEIVFLGPGKRRDEILRCILMGVRAIYCESLEELNMIETLAKKENKPTEVILRVNDPSDDSRHAIAMSGPSTQFGMDLDTLDHINRHYKRWPHCYIIGMHFYEGSNQNSIAATLAKITRHCDLFKKLHGIWHEPLHILGMGLGVGAMDPDDLLAVKTSQAWHKPLQALKEHIPSLEIYCESGRFLLDQVGSLVTQVQYTKTLHGKHWAVIDSGYHQHMTLCFENNYLRKQAKVSLHTDRTIPKQAPKRHYHVCGPLCTPSDRIHSYLKCPVLKRGDWLVFENTAAYGWQHSPLLFIGHPPPDFRLILKDKRCIDCNPVLDYFKHHTQGDKLYEDKDIHTTIHHKQHDSRHTQRGTPKQTQHRDTREKVHFNYTEIDRYQPTEG